MKKLDIKQINKKMSQLKGSRGTFESHWQEVADFFIPNRATITTKKSAGQKDAFQLLDNIGVQSNELLAGAMHGLLTNTDSQWFEFTTGDLATDNDDDARLFMQQSTRIIHNVLGNTNFHTELHEVYLEMPSLGTSCMFVDEDDRDVVRFSTKPIEDYLLGEDKMGVVNQVYYTQMLTAGAVCPPKVYCPHVLEINVTPLLVLVVWSVLPVNVSLISD